MQTIALMGPRDRGCRCGARSPFLPGTPTVESAPQRLGADPAHECGLLLGACRCRSDAAPGSAATPEPYGPRETPCHPHPLRVLDESARRTAPSGEGQPGASVDPGQEGCGSRMTTRVGRDRWVAQASRRWRAGRRVCRRCRRTRPESRGATPTGAAGRWQRNALSVPHADGLGDFEADLTTRGDAAQLVAEVCTKPAPAMAGRPSCSAARWFPSGTRQGTRATPKGPGQAVPRPHT